MFLYKVFCVFLLLNTIQAAKILCLFPTLSPSHLIVANGILTQLAKDGHETTMVSYFPLGKTMKNYRGIVLKPTDTLSEFQEIVAASLQNESMLLNFDKMIKIILKANDDVVQSPQFQKIATEEKFDLLLVESFMNFYLLGYGAQFNCPIIMINTGNTMMSLLNGFVGNPSEISYVTHILNDGVEGRMNFRQRVLNIVFSTMELASLAWMDKRNSDMYRKTFGHIPNFPSYEDQKKNISLVFINDHFTQSGNRPMVQNMVEIGGIQIKESPDPLPQDIKDWMESNPNGVIYFSLGSNVKITDLPPEKLQAILNTFRKINQNVLWKSENENIDGLPKNVMVKKWLPQDDLLTHPNLKLFITHGGLGSVAESQYHAVPLLVVPLFGDQMANANKVAQEGWGIRLDYEKLTEDTLYTAINEIISNPKYKQTIVAWSSLYRDRPQTAKQAVVYWTNYVLRYHGAPHLQSHAKELNFFQRYSIDTFSFIFVVLFLALYVQIKMLKWVIKFVIRKVKNIKNKVD